MNGTTTSSRPENASAIPCEKAREIASQPSASRARGPAPFLISAACSASPMLCAVTLAPRSFFSLTPSIFASSPVDRPA